MVIATFNASTVWVGETITGKGNAFTHEGHGPISVSDIMSYDEQGQLDWTSDVVQRWVSSLAQTEHLQSQPVQTQRPRASPAG